VRTAQDLFVAHLFMSLHQEQISGIGIHACMSYYHRRLPAIQQQLIRINASSAELEGNLSIPAGANGIVVFAHGSGSSRHSPRNRYVARALQDAGLGTVLIDLLTAAEEREDIRTGRFRFDIGLLAERVANASDWLAQNPAAADLRIGYFGASTGAAATLVAAAERQGEVNAVVSRGGRPDLAIPALGGVKAPTLLIVGGLDDPVIEMNREALGYLRVEKRLEIIPGATHLFEEPGALEEVARLAQEWFARYLGCAS
jgi:putative phosphoribosyl transferase